MSENKDLLQLAGRYHQAMPLRIRRYLNRRGIPNNIIDFYLLGWNGYWIAIPIWNREGKIAFFRLARDPDDPIPGAKMITTPGAYAELYGWNQILGKPSIRIRGTSRFSPHSAGGGRKLYRGTFLLPLERSYKVWTTRSEG